MKIKFESDDDLPLGKTFSIPDMIIVPASVLQKNGKYYPHIFLHDCAFKLSECCNTKELVSQKELKLIKQIHQNNFWFVIIGILKMLHLNLNYMFVINVMML